MWRDRAKNPRTFPAQTMDTTSETGIIVSGDRHRSVIRDKPTVVGRRLPYLNYPPHSENWPLLCSGPVAHPRGVRRGFLFGTTVTFAFDAYFTRPFRISRCETKQPSKWFGHCAATWPN